MAGNAIGQTTTPGAEARRATAPIIRTWRHARRLAAPFIRDRRAIAATEFAVIAPIMLVLFLGVIEITNGVTAYRKVSITAHTLSDLTSQSKAVQDSDLQGFFCLSAGIMSPYVALPCPVTSVNQTITELWINPSLQARVQWSVGTAALTPGTVVSVPTTLAIANTYVIYSTVSFLYTPVIGYVMSKAGVTLSDFSFTRPRQSPCVLYDGQATCPQT